MIFKNIISTLVFAALPVAAVCNDSKEVFTEIGANEFDNQVLKNNKITVVKFFKIGCPYCENMVPADKKMLAEFKEINFLAINKATNLELANTYEAKSVPTYVAFKDGIKIKTHESFLDEQRSPIVANYQEWLRSLKAASATK